MSKAILEFDLPEEKEEYNKCVNAGSFLSCIWNFFNYLRNMIKYGANNVSNNNTIDNILNSFLLEKKIKNLDEKKKEFLKELIEEVYIIIQKDFYNILDNNNVDQYL